MDYHTSLLAAVDARQHVHLVVGGNPLAASRVDQSLRVGARPVLVAPIPGPDTNGGLLPAKLQAHVDAGDVRWIQAAAFADQYLFTLGRDEVDGVVDAVFVTGAASPQISEHIATLCRRHRIPVNVVDSPQLCTFALLSTHTDGPLQVGVTTNGSGCKLAARIRREVAASLPTGLGEACVRLGAMRRKVIEAGIEAGAKTGEKRKAAFGKTAAETKKSKIDAEAGAQDDHPDDLDQSAAFNRLVAEGDPAAAKTRRMRWLAQLCEYRSLKWLASLTDEQLATLLEEYSLSTADNAATTASLDSPSACYGAGKIVLAGSGPGHPDLLTRAVHNAILQADLVLSDKLVPQGVLDLIPRRTELVIARKFPGNADAAQDELVAMAVAGARAGKTVLRLKQGDPFVYGRGGEEVQRLREAGLGAQVMVLPGLTSALTAPLFAGIPSTHRDVADQILICTGTGKKGRAPQPPGYRPSRTAVFLMGLHRIQGLVAELTSYTEADKAETTAAGSGEGANEGSKMGRRLWPVSTPCAVIERASCPDQKVMRTTLGHVVEAIAQEGSRPPGLLVVGRACEVLYKPEDDDISGANGVSRRPWTVEEGFVGMDLETVVPALDSME